MNRETDFERRRAVLIAELEAAFDGVSREDGTTLHEANVRDNRVSDAEQRAARRLDTEQIWQDVPDNDIADCCSAPSFLCPKGFRYYISAFMVYGLKHMGNDWNSILSSCMFHLLQDHPNSLRHSAPSAIAARYDFNEAQCTAIVKFLRFIVGDDVTMTKYSALEWRAVEKWEQYTNERNSTSKVE